MKIFLNKARSKKETNKVSNVTIDLKNNENLLPLTNISEYYNAYEQYLDEKKKSQIYRLSFNITPVCSNVLFNKVTEIIYHEGADDCVFFGSDKPHGNNVENIITYCKYKDIAFNNLNRTEMIKDTSFSHPKIGGVVYHCGFDIFNNHTLRKKEFGIINRLNSELDERVKNVFNTIEDFQRHKNGELVNDIIFDKNSKKEKINKHIYQIDNILTFEESINENLIEKNGWVGFINPTTLKIDNYVTNSISASINKCMNNNKACEMIDMYPDRSLFSFIPKVNKYRDNRIEKNWDYCLTYPYENYYNDIVQYETKDGVIINGLQCQIVDDIFSNKGTDNEVIYYDDYTHITLRTMFKNNFSINTLLKIVLIGEMDGEESVIYLDDFQKIISIGRTNSDKETYFGIYGDYLIENINKFDRPSQVNIRVSKVNNWGVCKYYFRKFKRIPNFKNTDVYVDNYVSKNEVEEYCNVNFNSTINSMGFSRTIYNDINAQLLFNDDINLKGLRDNLGREISNIYLTIVKNNQGNKEWYDDKDYCNENITNSRCFGKVTSGIKITDLNIFDYNVYKIHNVDSKLVTDESILGANEKILKNYQRWYKKVEKDGKTSFETPKPLEDDITIKGGDGNGGFLGDIVEFTEDTLTEIVLEEVYHRFNTRQREILDDEYGTIKVHDLISDDYEVGGSKFNVVEREYNKISNDLKLPINIDAEGYYYKAHYKIPLKEYKNTINRGFHTLINVASYNNRENDLHSITTSEDFYFTPMDYLYIYRKNDKKLYNGEVVDIDKNNRLNIKIRTNIPESDSLSDYIIFKHNIEKPDTGYNLHDGSGMFLWSDFKEDHEYDINSEISKYSFTNNAHYINKNIIFYLHRQDPKGEFEISNISSEIPMVSNLTVDGDKNNYENIETMIKDIEEGILC